MTMHPSQGLNPVRDVMSNGVVLLAKTAGSSPAVTIRAALRAGSIWDPPGMPGRSYFLSRVLDRGTPERSGEELADELDGRGVSLQIAVTRHVLTVTCECLAEDFESVLEVLADMVRSPLFPADEVDKRRLEIQTTLRQDEENTGLRASEALASLIYGPGHPYGAPARGTQASIAAIGRNHLAALHQASFTPGSLSLAIVGDLEADAALDAARRAFGDWRAAPTAGPALAASSGARQRRSVVIPMMNKVQADIAYGFLGLARRDAAYHAAVLMNNILGQYGLGGRLGEAIRERQGMAYYAFSAFDGNVLPGPLVIRVGVGPEDVDRALASIDEQLQRLVGDGVTARELEDSRRYLVGSIPRALETNAGIAKFLQIVEQFGLGTDYDRVLPDLYGAVTVEQVNEVARALLDPERASVVIAGPYDPGCRGADEVLLTSEPVAS
jgi:zinc protease